MNNFDEIQKRKRNCFTETTSNTFEQNTKNITFKALIIQSNKCTNFLVGLFHIDLGNNSQLFYLNYDYINRHQQKKRLVSVLVLSISV